MAKSDFQERFPGMPDVEKRNNTYMYLVIQRRFDPLGVIERKGAVSITLRGSSVRRRSGSDKPFMDEKIKLLTYATESAKHFKHHGLVLKYEPLFVQTCSTFEEALSIS